MMQLQGDSILISDKVKSVFILVNAGFFYLGVDISEIYVKIITKMLQKIFKIVTKKKGNKKSAEFV